MQNIQVHELGSFPIIKHYMETLDIPDIFKAVLPLVKGDPIHASCLCVLLENILISVKPLYKISEWLTDYTDGRGEFGYEANTYNDDRLGAALDALYSSDRHSLMSTISSNAIKAYELKTEAVHNDTTTVTLKGDYKEGATRDSVTPAIGYNKDGFPKAKQIVFGLNTLSDGQVPISATWYSGNVADSDTHIPNWEALKELLQKTDFIYIGDSKVATMENMNYIAKHEGLFISILPASRSEVKDFKLAIQSQTIQPAWEVIRTQQDSRNKNKEIVYKAFGKNQTKEGHTLHWIHSSAKEEQDAARRVHRIDKINKELTELALKLNKYYLKTPEQIQTKLDKILGKDAALFDVNIREIYKIKETKIGAGRIGKDSKFEIKVVSTYSIEWSVKEQEVARQSRIDGLFPLVTNTSLEAKEVLAHYKGQPFLEKRFCTFKSILEIAPVFLKLPHRIEAMLFLYFLALMIVALIEREIRQNMVKKEIKKLPILPQKANTEQPTWNNIRYFFQKVFFMAEKNILNQFLFLVKGLNRWHLTVLKLLNVPLSVYDIKSLNWWKFSPI